MPVNISPQVGRAFEREDTFFLELVGLRSDQSASAFEVADRLRDIGTGGGDGMSYVSEPILLGDRVLLMLDAKGLASSDVALALRIVNDGLSSATSTATVDVAEGTDQFHDSHDAVPIVSLAIMRPADYYKQPTGRIAAAADVIFAVVRKLVPDATPIYRVGIDVPVSWDFLETVIGTHRDGAAGTLAVLLADAELVIDVKLSALGPHEVQAAGPGLLEVDRFAQVVDALKQVAAEAPGQPTSTIIKPGNDRSAVAVGPRSRGVKAVEQIGDRASAFERFAPGVGWSLTIAPELWDCIEVTESPCDVQRLGDGRVELTFGSAAEWAPWLSPETRVRAAAAELLAPHLIAGDDWWKIEKEFSSTVVREWRSANPS